MKVLTETGLSQLITNIKTGFAAKTHTHDAYAASTHSHVGTEVALTGYSKASSAAAVAATDTVNAAIGKLEKALDGKQASGSYLTSVSWNDIDSKPSSFTPASHEHTTSDVTALTGYTIASSAAAIAATDSLNTALGKLEKSIDGKLGSSATAADSSKLGGTAAASYALLASPAFSGTPTAPTAAANTNTTQIATTAFVQTAVANLVNSAPTTLDTLAELSAALGDDPNFATTIATQIGGKANASHTHVGTEVTLTGYTKASSASAVAATDTVNAAIGKLEKALDGKQASGSYAASDHTHDTYVPTTRKVNNNALSADITLSGADIAATGYTKAASVAAIAATDTINAALGKLEKALDGKQASGSYAVEGHTHNYAGSSTAGGAATSAEKISTAAKIGDTNNPVYIAADGTVTAISYTIGTSVPSGAVFTDTKLGSDHVLTGYTKAGSAAAVAAADSVNTAIGKLEYKIDAIAEYTAEEVIAVWEAS